MIRQGVVSSNIAAIGYEPDQGLEVQFHSGAVYAYPEVDAATWDILRLEAEYAAAGNGDASVGKMLHRHVKKRYPAQKLNGPTPVGTWLVAVDHTLCRLTGGGRASFWGDMLVHFDQLVAWREQGLTPEKAADVLFASWIS